MAIRIRKLLMLTLYGVGVSSLSFVLSLFGVKKGSIDGFSHLAGDALDIPNAQADVPSGAGAGDNGDDCEGGEGGEDGDGDC